jgi:hypothetical protein
MFDWASSFEQDLRDWDFSGKIVVVAFWETQMLDAYYPVGCDDSNECRAESSSELQKHAFFDKSDLYHEILRYTRIGQVAWGELNCQGVLCRLYYRYAKLLT